MALDKLTDAYLHELTPERDPLLSEMEEIARERNFPIIGPLVGRILYQLTALKKARRVFEMGSGYGYSTYWFLRATPPDGVVYYTDGSKENFELARGFFRRAELDHKVRMELGDAIEILKRQQFSFDIILNDIDKEFYPTALPVALKKLKKGGLLITDNMFWDGDVVAGKSDPATSAIREYTRSLYDSPDLFTTILPVRDGVAVSLKIA